MTSIIANTIQTSHTLSEQNILQFIDSKIQHSLKLHIPDILYYYNKIIGKSLVNTYEVLENLEYALICSDIVSIIFWILLEYTYNLKISLFLCDRAILYYTEYLEMFLTSIPNKEIQDKIKLNFTDVKMFIYSKTIGPLLFQKLHHTKKSLHHFYQKIRTIANQFHKFWSTSLQIIDTISYDEIRRHESFQTIKETSIKKHPIISWKNQQFMEFQNQFNKYEQFTNKFLTIHLDTIQHRFVTIHNCHTLQEIQTLINQILSLQ